MPPPPRAMRQGADVSAADRWGNTPLKEASALHGPAAAAVRDLLLHAPRFAPPSPPPQDACTSGAHSPSVHSVAPSTRSHASRTSSAAPPAASASIDAVLQAAADGDVPALMNAYETNPTFVHRRNCDARTALHEAATEGRAEAVRWLLDAG